jgi:predicted enzyme related to lactoylglutathione lyase
MIRAHFILYVRDQHLSSRFYQQVLGCAPRLEVPGMTEFELSGGAILGLMPESGIQRLIGVETRPAVARCELYLLLADLQGALRRALEAGAELIQPAEARDWGDRVGYLRDPDGHILALAEPLKG